MNNLPLQPIIWSRSLTAQSALHEYQVRKDVDSKDKFLVKCTSRRGGKSQIKATGFATIDEAKQWAWNHYNEKMQPYVKTAPTWVDASKQLPNVDRDTQFVCAYDSAIDTFSKVAWFNADIGKFDYQHDDVLAWMPIPEFK